MKIRRQRPEYSIFFCSLFYQVLLTPYFSLGFRLNKYDLAIASNYTVSTFFSAVTATTSQFSFNQTDTRLANGVNSFWFASLVFAIGASMHSLVRIGWEQAL